MAFQRTKNQVNRSNRLDVSSFSSWRVVVKWLTLIAMATSRHVSTQNFRLWAQHWIFGPPKAHRELGAIRAGHGDVRGARKVVWVHNYGVFCSKWV